MARITVRVKPGASRAKVGGAYGDPPALVVAVNAPPVDGRANEAVVKAVAEAFGVRATDVTVVSGHQGRTKVLSIDADEAGVAARLAGLLIRPRDTPGGIRSTRPSLEGTRYDEERARR